jgi:hypothetical protein
MVNIYCEQDLAYLTSCFHCFPTKSSKLFQYLSIYPLAKSMMRIRRVVGFLGYQSDRRLGLEALYVAAGVENDVHSSFAAYVYPFSHTTSDIN